MSNSNDDLMYTLLKAKRDGEKIYYAVKGEGGTKVLIPDDHAWDLAGLEYTIQRRREYIIKIDDRDKEHPRIEQLSNNWTRSDFGKYEMGEFILMREVYQDEM